MKKIILALPLLLLAGCVNETGGDPNPSKETTQAGIQKRVADPGLSPEAKAQIQAAQEHNSAMSQGMQRMPPPAGGGGR